MVRIDENKKSVRFPEAVDERLTLLSRKLGRTKRELFMQMVDYFYKSKKDPADLNDEVLKKELSSGISRILSFIRKQEGDMLVPMYSAMEELMAIAKAQSPLLKNIGKGQSEDHHGQGNHGLPETGGRHAEKDTWQHAGKGNIEDQVPAGTGLLYHPA